MTNSTANLKPFAKGQSGNPAGRPRKNVSLDAWRTANAAILQDVVDAAEAKDMWLRWAMRFKAGDAKALWMVPYLFGQPPKPVEPEQAPGDARPTTIVFEEMAPADRGAP